MSFKEMSNRFKGRTPLFLGMAALALIWSAPAEGQAPIQRAMRHYREAITQYNLGRYEFAADKFQAAIRADPTLPGPYRWLGLTYRAMNKCDLALPYFRRYLQLKPVSRYNDRIREEVEYCASQVGEESEAVVPAGAAQLVIRVSERGAQIHIDGVLRGSTPTGALPVQPGQHTINVHKRGFMPWTTALKVEEGEVRVLEVTLRKDPTARTPEEIEMAKRRATGLLQVLGMPQGAVLSVDGKMVRLNDRGEALVPEGNREVLVSLEGTEPWSRRVTIHAGSRTTVMPTLELTKQSKTLKRWAWITTGAAAVLAVGGAVVGMLENQRAAEVRDYDRENGTRQELIDMENGRKTLALTANVLYSLSMAALGTGVVLFAISPEIERPEKGPTRVLISGAVSF